MAGRLHERPGDSQADRRWRRGTAAILIAIASGTALAKSVSAPFAVSVTVFPPFKDVADCGTNQQGGNVTLNCATPVSDNHPRFLLHVYREGAQVGTVDGATAPGTVTSWKVVRIADRDFLEIVVGW